MGPPLPPSGLTQFRSGRACQFAARFGKVAPQSPIAAGFHMPLGSPTPPDWLAAPQRRGLAVVLLLAYAWLFPYSEQINNPNEFVRIYMARAIVDHHTYAIGRREAVPGGGFADRGSVMQEWGYVNDKALMCNDPRQKPPDCAGALYPAKAPGMSLLGVVPYWLQKQVFALRGAPLSKPAIVWWLRLCCVVLPSVAGAYLLILHLTRRLRRPELGLGVGLAAALGSLSLTYGQMFAGHQPAGLALLFAYLAGARTATTAEGTGTGRRWVVLAGLGIGLATLIEFPAAPAGLLLAGWLLLRRRRWSDLLWLALGGLGPALALAHFDTVAFGAPWQLPYSHLENPEFVKDMAPGFMGIALPTKEKLAGSLVSPFTGLYFWAPWAALGWLGVLAARRTVDTSGLWATRRGEALIAWIICLYFLFFQTTHALWRGGWVVGPRYITAIVPFAALAAAHGLDSLRGVWQSSARIIFSVGSIVAIVFAGAATAVCQGFPLEVWNPLNEVVQPLIAHGFIWSSPLYWLGTSALVGALPYFAALATGMVAVAGTMNPFSEKSNLFRMVTTLCLLGAGLAMAAVLWRLQPPVPRAGNDQRSTVRYLMQTWWPQAPRGSKPLPAEPVQNH